MDSIHKSFSLIIIEDNDVLRHMLAQRLREEKHSVIALSCAEEMEDVATGQPVDVFLVDLNLPGEDGLSLTQRLRATYPLAGIIIMTARSRLNDKVDGYTKGADIYLTKPFEAAELCAAVQAQGQRVYRMQNVLAEQDVYTLIQYQLQIRKRGGEAITLSSSEVSILATLARAPNRRLEYWQIAEALGLDVQTYAKASLEVRIVRLRKKLLEAGTPTNCIEAIRGHGYQLCIDLKII